MEETRDEKLPVDGNDKTDSGPPVSPPAKEEHVGEVENHHGECP